MLNPVKFVNISSSDIVWLLTYKRINWKFTTVWLWVTNWRQQYVDDAMSAVW